MPLKTFFNLQQARQQQILDVAFREFALNEYQTASLGNIIKELGIAKGSFYRYFRDKKDLYFYLIDYAENLRMKQLEGLLKSSCNDFYSILTENFAMKVKFDLEHPVYSGFQYNLTQEKNNEEIGNIQLRMKQKVRDLVMHIMQPFISKGEFRTDIPPEDLAYMVVQMQWGMFDYLEMKYGISFRENVKNGKPVFSIPEEQIIADVRRMASLILSGIKQSQS